MMTKTAKRLKKQLVSAGFTFNGEDKFVRAFNGIVAEIYCFNSEIGVNFGTLKSNYWEDNFFIKSNTFKPDTDIKTILNFCEV